MLDARLAERVVWTHLDEHVHEGVTLEVVATEPFVEYVEDRQESCTGFLGPPPRLGDHGVRAPDLRSKLQEFGRELVLGRVVAIEGGNRDAGCSDDLVHADVANPALGEELVSGHQDALSCTYSRSVGHVNPKFSILDRIPVLPPNGR